MRKYLSNILFALVAVFAAGCVEVNIYPVEPQTPATVTLQLRNTDLVATRVDVTDDSNNNEDRIENVQCFFTSSTDDDTIIYRSGIKEFNNISGSTQITISDIPANIFQSLSKVYVVANYEGDLTQETSIEGIQAKEITLGTGAKQDSFVMDGASPLNRTGVTTVDLERVAAKIVVKVNINKSIQEDGHSWEPVTDSIKMTYTGGIVTSKISAETPANTVKPDGYTQVPVKGETLSTVFTLDSENPTTTEYVGYQTVPFYSFPVAAGDVPEGEITMTIPWTTRDGENTSTIEYTYEIPVEIAFERNKVYIIDVDVNVLGAPVEKTLTPSYIVLDWNNTPIDATLSKPQYLVVDQNYVVMNNEQEISVGYASSDPVQVEIISSTVHDWVYERDSKGNQYIVSGAADTNESVALENGAIVYRHNLDNTREDGEYDFLVQTIEVCIYHKTNDETTAQNAKIKENITFVQYPALYVETGTSVSGSVYVNNTQSSSMNSNSNNSWAYVGSGSQGMSSNMYKISVGAFDASTANYIICDPREPSNEENFTFGNVSTALDATRADNTLTGYRATIVGPESANLVAPEFIVASGYGYYQVSWQNMYAKTSAKYRCAGYQEAGYPAGRWRVPTPAELEVIGKLCSEGKIPSIFYGTYSYMSSNGPYYYNSDGTFRQDGDVNKNGNSIRCVYDTWYWKDKCKNVNDFIWGAEGDTKEHDKSAYLVSVE